MNDFSDWRAKDVMSTPVSVGPEATLAEVEAILEGRGFNMLPVVDASDELLGIVTSLDLLRAFDFSEDEIAPHYGDAMGRPVRSVMRTDVRSVTPRAPLPRVLRKLVDAGLKSLPVLDGDRLVGVIAREDVMGALRRATSGERPRT